MDVLIKAKQKCSQRQKKNQVRDLSAPKETWLVVSVKSHNYTVARAQCPKRPHLRAAFELRKGKCSEFPENNAHVHDNRKGPSSWLGTSKVSIRRHLQFKILLELTDSTINPQGDVEFMELKWN